MRWRRSGYVATETIGEADLVLLNTCHIREKATEKVYSELGRIRAAEAASAERAGREMMIAVAGCVAQAEGEEIMRRAPAVDLVVGPQILSPAARAGAPRRAAARRSSRPTSPSRTSSSTCRRSTAPRSAAAASPPSSPCRKAATSSAPSAWCPIRAARKCRGRSAQIVAEAERLAAAGVREVTLLGQNVNAWHGEGPDGGDWGLGRLLFRLAEIPGLARLRYTTSHPRDMDDELIAAHRDLPALMPYLHLPVQAGSDRVLQGDEPPPHRGRLSAADRAHPRRAARHRHVRRLHRRLPRRDRGRLRGDAASWSARSATPRPSRSNIRRRPGTPGADMAGQVPEAGEGRAAAAPAGAARGTAARFRRFAGRPRRSIC